TAINPISEPALSADGTLTFRNAAVDADFARAPAAYRAVWSRFDNATGQADRIGETMGRTTTIAAPHGLPRDAGAFLKVELSSAGAERSAWEMPVNAFFRLQDGQWRLVGFERMAS